MLRPSGKIATYLSRLVVARPKSEPLGPSLWLTSAFSSAHAEDFLESATEVRTTSFYTRYGNPTVRAFEDAIAFLEGTEAAIATPSGMAALSLALATFVPAGGRILAQDALYGGTEALLENLASRHGIELVRFRTGDCDALADSAQKGASIALFETPANPLLEVTNLEAAAGICRGHRILSIVDSSIATPINQNPAALGFDLVAHSATKAIGGHDDFTAGVIATTNAMVERLWDNAHILGTFLDPFSAWLAIRSLRTLPLRVERLNDTAMAIAEALTGHRAIRKVYYPGLADHEGHDIARRQMRGFGGVLSLDFEAGADAAARFLDRFSGARRSASFGGPSTLVVQPAAMWAGLPDKAAGRVGPGLVRLSVGLEDPAQLLGELLEALD